MIRRCLLLFSFSKFTFRWHVVESQKIWVWHTLETLLFLISPFSRIPLSRRSFKCVCRLITKIKYWSFVDEWRGKQWSSERLSWKLFAYVCLSIHPFAFTVSKTEKDKQSDKNSNFSNVFSFKELKETFFLFKLNVKSLSFPKQLIQSSEFLLSTSFLIYRCRFN